MRSANPHALPGKTTGIRSATILFVIILAFLGQSLITQSHFHLVAIPSAAPAAEKFGASLQVAAASDDQDKTPACPICEEVAQAGVYLLAAAVTFIAPGPFVLWHEITSILELALRQRSHAWQSRAPPLLLHA